MLTDKKYSRKARERAWKQHDELDYENRRLATEINAIKEHLNQKSIRQQATHVAATSLVMHTQTTGTTSTSTTSMAPVEWTPQNRAIKELMESRNTPDESIDMDAWNKMLYGPSYGTTPESKPIAQVSEPVVSNIPSKQTTTSMPTTAPQPSMLGQAKDGATFFVKNVELDGIVQTAQGAEAVGKFLKDDGTADYLLGKPAKYALGSCIVAVGVPGAIATMCPLCAPFMMPALSAGLTYCSGAVPVAGASAVIENAAHLAGYETTITKTRKKVHDDAIVAATKPEYEMSDDQFSNRLGVISSDQLKKMKTEYDSWQTTADYSFSSVEQYKAKNELRLGKLVGEELEIRALRPAHEMSDEENRKILKGLDVERIKEAKQKQEDLIKAGANSTSRKDKYLASRAQYYLKHTEQELALREKLIHKTITIVPEEKQKPGCTNGAEHFTPTNGTPLLPPLDIKDKPGCIQPPIEAPKPLVTLPVEEDWRDHILTQAKPSDKGKKEEKEERKQYSGPKYDRTEDWVATLPSEVQKYVVRTKEINKKKRVFQFEKGYGDIGKKDKVVVDSLHHDHLEVFDSTGTEWKFAANFDGTKNIEKTNQVKKPREIKS